MKVPELNKNHLYIFFAFIVLLIILLVLNKLGLLKIKTQAEKDLDKKVSDIQTMGVNDYFDPKYYKTLQVNKTPIQLVTQKSLSMIYEKFNKALRGWGTNEAGLFTIFDNYLNTKTKISQFSEYCKSKGKSLKQMLIDDLSENDLKNFFKLIDSKPTGIIAKGKVI